MKELFERAKKHLNYLHRRLNELILKKHKLSKEEHVIRQEMNKTENVLRHIQKR